MPRQARVIVPSCMVHIRSRIVDGRYVFDDAGRREYLSRLDRALAQSDWVLISYGLPDNHVHLGAIPGRTTLDSWIGPLHNAFAQWVNRSMRARGLPTLGPVFGDRPGTNPVPFEAAPGLIAYQHNQGVHARVVERARDSDWTSHRAYLGYERRVASLDVERGLELCGMTALEFDEYVASRVKPPPSEPARWIVWCAAREVGLVAEELPGNRSMRAVLAKRVALKVAMARGVELRAIAHELGLTPRAARLALKTRDPEAEQIAEELLRRDT